MPLRFALIGTGRIADDQLAPALRLAAGAELWSVLSRDRARAAAFAARHGAAASEPAHDDLDRLLADPQLDAVLIASPDRLHAEQAIAAARAGKHVLTEKPMATDTDQGRAMIEACRAAGVRLGVAYHMRWHAGHRAIAARVHAGEFGRIHHMRVQWTWLAADASNWRAHEDVGRWWGLAGVGTHCLDQVRWMMGPSSGEVVRLRSVIDRSVWGGPHDETAVLALQFENGATTEICTSVLFQAPRRMEIHGERHRAVFDDTLGAHGDGRITVDGEPFAFEVRNPYVGEIEDFVAAVRDGREPEVGGAEALRNVELLVEAVA